MSLVINPVDLIKGYLIKQGYFQSNQNQLDENALHQSILMGAAILINDMPNISNYCWDKDYGAQKIEDVILQAVSDIEEDLGCYNQGDKTNRDIIRENREKLLEEEKKIGTKIYSLL